jgi:hypothetical protein
MMRPNKLQLTHNEIELTNNDIQDVLLDIRSNEYRATQIQGDFFSSLAECVRDHDRVNKQNHVGAFNRRAGDSRERGIS